nr:tyrosine-type recombinase/integrase [Succinivibrio sp.]
MLSMVQLNVLIKQAQKEQSTINRAVETNLAVRILPSGKVTWFAKLKLDQRSLAKTLGNYPEVTLAEARRMKSEWVELQKSLPADVRTSYTVKDAFEDWAIKKKQTARSFDYMWMRVNKYILPKFGRLQLKDLTAAALIRAWRPLEAEGHIETCRKLCEYTRDMAIFVQNTGRVENMHDLTHVKANYPPTPKRHLAAMTPEQLPDLFYALERLPRIYGTVWQAMMCQFYTLSRAGEIAEMKWEWIDFNAKVIRFPAEIMKMKQPHDVPITTQLEALLRNMPQSYE